MRKIKVLQRQLSQGEILDKQRKATSDLAKVTSTYTYSVKVGDLHYQLHQAVKT